MDKASFVCVCVCSQIYTVNKQEENLGIEISEMVQLVVVARVSFFQRKWVSEMMARLSGNWDGRDVSILLQKKKKYYKYG